MPNKTDQMVTIAEFNRDFRIGNRQYEVGKTYDIADCGCEEFLGSIENPLILLRHHTPSERKYAEIVQTENLNVLCGNVSSTKMQILREISVGQMVDMAIGWMMKQSADWHPRRATDITFGTTITHHDDTVLENKSKNNVAINDGRNAVVVNYAGASMAVANGFNGVAVNSGDYSLSSHQGREGVVVNSGLSGLAIGRGINDIAVNNGDFGHAINAGMLGIAVNNGNKGIAMSTARNGIAINNVDDGKAVANGECSVAISIGDGNRVRAEQDGSALVLILRDADSGEILHTWAGIVGQNGIEPDVMYRLNRDGKVEVVK